MRCIASLRHGRKSFGFPGLADSVEQVRKITNEMQRSILTMRLVANCNLKPITPEQHYLFLVGFFFPQGQVLLSVFFVKP